MRCRIKELSCEIRTEKEPYRNGEKKEETKTRSHKTTTVRRESMVMMMMMMDGGRRIGARNRTGRPRQKKAKKGVIIGAAAARLPRIVATVASTGEAFREA